MNSVTLIVPCYNEADSVPILYKALCDTATPLVDRFSFTFIFVDDGSTDNTLNVIKDIADRDLDVKYISFSRNFGKESAMLAGMRAASSDLVGLIDADMQHSPALIPDMLEAVTDGGYDVAAACRSDREGEEKFKSFLSKQFYKVIDRISDIKINESAQDYRIMKKAVVDSILSMPEHDRFSKGIFTWVGFNVKWFPHENAKRVAGQTKWSIKKLTKYALDGIIGFTNAPLRLPLYFGAASGFTCLVLLILMLVRAIVIDNYRPTMLLPLSMLFLLAALILISIGIVGAYLARVFDEAKGRPQYFVAQTNIRKF